MARVGCCAGFPRSCVPRLTDPADSPVRTIPIPALDPLTVGWAARQWNALSPLAAEFAELLAAQQ